MTIHEYPKRTDMLRHYKRLLNVNAKFPAQMESFAYILKQLAELEAFGEHLRIIILRNADYISETIEAQSYLQKRDMEYGVDIMINLDGNRVYSLFEIHNNDGDDLVIDCTIPFEQGKEYKRIIMNDNGWEVIDIR